MPDTIRAAGVLLMHDGNVLLMNRADGEGWAFPGGKIEPEDAADVMGAVRECVEETGYKPSGLTEFARSNTRGVDFTTFAASVEGDRPDIVMCDEHTGYVWVKPDEAMAMELHPGVRSVMTKMTGHELDVARLIRDGELTSPQRFLNVWLYAMRITGTGHAYRSTGDEFVHRDPEHYLTDEMLARCNGLPVIFVHPEKSLLDSQEYHDRNVGVIFLPYIKGDEIWGIAKIYDEATIDILNNVAMSTSPGVKLRLGEMKTQNLDDGAKLLIEQAPQLLDHLAIVEQGVWDKAGDPRGIISEGVTMADDKDEPEKKDAEPDKFDAFCAKVDGALTSIMDRMDAFEAKKADADEPEKKDAEEEPAKKDSDDEAKADAAALKADNDQLRAKIADLDARTAPRSDADIEAIADAQAKADSAATALGERINTRPMDGEAPLAYRARMASRFKTHSATWKDSDMSLLAKADAATFGKIEEAVYADALAVAQQPTAIAEGDVRMVLHTDPDTGRRTKTFQGDIKDAYAVCMRQGMRATLNKPVETRH